MAKEGKYKLVISDRELASHYAYGNSAVGPSKINLLFDKFCSEINQDLRGYVIYLKADIEETTKRLNARRKQASPSEKQPLDSVEVLGQSHQEKVKTEYERLFEERPDLFIKIFTIDANQSLEHIENELRNIIEQIIKE
ncbi:MAG: hypothetical protein EOP45_07710 [Sphingobacteriaceae bacterium]|nr:MAG: hypothetical protein EOP45_07710 [Sphingobacteriaceae bacterium]